jgi:hypothetical protein
MLIQRIAALGVIVTAAFATAACDNAADKERQADKAQVQADQKKVEAQQSADQQRAAADQQLAKEQSDYRDKIQTKIGDEDKRLDDLQASAANETGAAKTDSDRLLGDVTAKKGALQADLRQVGNVTADQWETLKTKIDKDLDAFSTSVRTASSQIKATPGRARTTTTTTTTATATATANPGYRANPNPVPAQP